MRKNLEADSTAGHAIAAQRASTEASRRRLSQDPDALLKDVLRRSRPALRRGHRGRPYAARRALQDYAGGQRGGRGREFLCRAGLYESGTTARHSRRQLRVGKAGMSGHATRRFRSSASSSSKLSSPPETTRRPSCRLTSSCQPAARWEQPCVGACCRRPRIALRAESEALEQRGSLRALALVVSNLDDAALRAGADMCS
jgi:hypothetical protein